MRTAFLNEDHESIREMSRDFAEKVLAPVAAEIDEQDCFPNEVRAAMQDLGFFGLKIPEEYGGIGADTRSYAVVMEEICAKSASAGILISQANSLSTQPLILAGTEEQKNKWLPGVANGTNFIAFALTEPNAGSDSSGMRTHAVKDAERYVINGGKCFITGAPIATHAVVFAKTAPEKGAKGISGFMIDMDMPGVGVGKHEKKMGNRGVPVSDLILEEVVVEKDRMIGEENLGFITAMKTLSVGRIGAAAAAVGIAQGAMDEAVKFVKARKQFGQELSKFQGLQFMLADIEAKLRACRLLVYEAAYYVDIGADANMAASVAKYYCTETAVEIVNKALQLHGGYGYVTEYPVERMYRDVRFHCLGEGTSQIQQLVIARELLK